MHDPYTEAPATAFAIAQTATGVVLGASIVRRRLLEVRPRALLLGSCALATLAPLLPHATASWLLDLAAALPIAALLRGNRALLVLAVVLAAGSLVIHHTFINAAFVFGALQLAWLGALAGLLSGTDAKPVPDTSLSPLSLRDHRRLFMAMTTVGAISSVLVFRRTCVMDDEWAYTFQAHVFSHLRTHMPAPSCREPFDNLWVYHWQGRTFSQFTPGFPLYLAPFARLELPWLANPVALGLVAAGAARLARRLVEPRAARVATVIAVASVALSPSVLLNAGSRFSHVFVMALLAWSTEAACVLLLDRASGRRGIAWSASLGVALAWLVATRPADGLALGSGIVVVLALAVARRQLAPEVLLPAVFTLLGGGLVTLVILRLQLGEWFRTGYSLTAMFHPWAELHWTPPARNELDQAFPLGSATYCFFPATLALGLAGLFAARGAQRALASMLLIGGGALLVLYVFVDFARLHYWSYGPRYHLPLVLALSVGTAAWLAPLVRALGKRIEVGLAIAVAAALVLIARPMLRSASDEASLRTATLRAIERERLHNAVVWVARIELSTHPSALVQNPPFEDPDVVVASREVLGEEACLKARYPNRSSYRAIGKGEVELIPE